MKQRLLLLLPLAIGVILFAIRAQSRPVDNSKWDSLAGSYPDIVLAEVRDSDAAYKHEFTRFLKNDSGMTRAFAQARISLHDRADLKEDHVVGKQAIFLFRESRAGESPNIVGSGPTVARVFYVYDGRIGLQPTDDAYVELDYITKRE